MSDKTDSTTSGGPRHQPKQTRSQETWNSILEAATALFAEKGYEQTTTHQIASQAGVSVGALYRYFSDKQAILKELYGQEITGLRNRLLEEFSLADLVGQDVRQLVRKTMALAFRIYSERPGLRRVLGEQSRKIPELAELRRNQEAEVDRAVLQILSTAPGVRLPDPEVSAYLVSLFIESLIDDHVLHGNRGEARFEDNRVIDAATDFIMRYVLVRSE